MLGSEDITTLLNQARTGDAAAREAVFRLIENELRAMAHAKARTQRTRIDLSTTMLVHDAFLRLIGTADLAWEDRRHFYRFANRVMWQITTDRLREADAQKRPRLVPFEALADWVADKPSLDLVAIEDLLQQLERYDELLADIARWRWMGCTWKEIADMVGLSEGQVKHRFKEAQGWLRQRWFEDPDHVD